MANVVIVLVTHVYGITIMPKCKKWRIQQARLKEQAEQEQKQQEQQEQQEQSGEH